MLQIKMRRDEKKGPWLEIGSVADHYELSLNMEQRTLEVTAFSNNNSAHSVSTVRFEGDDFSKLLELINQGHIHKISSGAEAAEG